jgi:hypothetical protein
MGVARPPFPKTLRQFQADFGTEAACQQYLTMCQVYLDEFVFRRNRRKTPAAAFQTLLGLGVGRKSTEYEQIRGARDLNHNRLGFAEATG